MCIIFSDLDRAPLESIIVGHLTHLSQDFHSYLLDFEMKYVHLDWVRTAFILSKATRSKLPVTDQEELLEVSSDCNLQFKFAKSTTPHFWVSVKQEYPDLGQKSLVALALCLHIFMRGLLLFNTVIKTKPINLL
ncbi:unnamed protein product [Lepeophtheirus salmonis]|uniref:(salmon louse) hypothetical protein n=1 Tax=Lepeophtheirus salmonis TaxID=72036 RepID=A0A7R8CSC3_LEPSM|nr:unnamed protein product [Lepeophtheirus salmonis]CAF2878249.1 unnamed protein product [Lepeophtheirus salmonis]